MDSKTFKRYTVTAALPYANGPIHIGHLAGVYVPADIYVRYLRSKQKDVLFLCGSDEHGVPITIRARKEEKSPQEVVDKYHTMIKDSFDRFGIKFDIYSRTSNKIHHKTASQFFLKLYNDGVFKEETSEQYFDEENKQFLADRYIIGICPNCGYKEAYGDQCESCGSSLSPSELIEPRSALSGAKPVLKETKHWYLPLEKYENWLKEWILDEHKKDWKTNVYGQCKSWLDQGLQPRAVTRDLDWGVPVPLKEGKGKVLYVWFDAPIGYITAAREWSQNTGKDWEPYWKDNDSRLIHFIGKDNIVFHCIIFPAMLHAHGEYLVPDNVPANEFLNLENDKISTSKNWAVWLHEFLEELPDKQDVLRYVLCANAPETKDNDFTWRDFQARNNNELVAVLGNFINRALVLTHNYFDGHVPERGELFDPDKQLIDNLTKAPDLVAGAMNQFKFREALSHFMDLARAGNKFLADTEPWKLIKENEKRVATIMNLALQVAANLAILGAPFLPFSMGRLNKMINADQWVWWDAGSIDLLSPGHPLNKPELLFKKIDKSVVEHQIKKLEENRKENTVTDNDMKALKDEINFDDFVKMDMRIGTILEAEKVKKSKKLLKLKVDTGIDKRTVVSGIAEFYSPESLVGQKVTVLINLAPRKIMGIESKGMILMAEDSEGKLGFLQPDKSISDGSTIS